MSTVQTGNAMDPPQVTTNVVGFKRLRKHVTMTGGAGTLTLDDVRTCLPLTAPELRFVKLSVWGDDTENLSCVFPVGSSTNLHPGDNAVWSDTGVPGNARAQIHLTPAFEYRNFWFDAGMAGTTVLATFGSSPTDTATLIVDVTVQYRTAVQSCPAFAHLQKLQQLKLV